MSISPNDLRPGSVFKDNKGNVLQVIESQHVKLSKGGACCRIKYKNLITGGIAEDRFNVNSTLGDVFIEKTSLTYSYTENNIAYFMNPDYEMVDYRSDSLGDLAGIFRGGIEFKEMPQIAVRTFIDEDSGRSYIIDVELLNDIVLQVTDTRPSIKGEAAKTGTKPATVEGDIHIKVPPHVNTGDYVVLSKVDLSYIGKK